MTDWYRRKTWTKTDEEEFFVKLGRARKDGQAQFLKVQSIELIQTQNKRLLSVAEKLLNRILTDYPDNRLERSATYNHLGEIYKLRNDYDTALKFFQKSLDYEQEYPNSITNAYLNFSETVIEAQKTELYEQVFELLTKEINEDTLKFPTQNYIMYSILSVISQFRGHSDQARIYSELAEKNATRNTNLLWKTNKNKIGVVKERVRWLDKLVRGNRS